MIPTNNETYILELYERVENSEYLYKDIPTYSFKGRPANNYEKREYKILTGVDSGVDSVYIYSSNLELDNIKIGDKVIFLGKPMLVSSIGYYFDSARLINASILNESTIVKRCPKGITLQ